MELIKEISSSESYCAHQTQRLLKSNLKLMDDIIEFYNDLFQKQNKDETDIKCYEMAILLIHVKIIKIIYCNLDLLKKGHYNEFQSLLRDEFELIFLAQYFFNNHEKVGPWLEGGQINHRHVANSLKLSSDIRGIYGSLCDYTHPNIKSAAKNLVFLKRRGCFEFVMISIPQRKIAKRLILTQMYFSILAINHFFDCFKGYNNFDENDEKQMKQFKNKLNKQLDIWVKYCDELKLIPTF